MSNLNSVSLVGRLCADVEMKKSAKGTDFTSVNLAVDDYNGKEKVCYFFQVNVIGKSAVALGQFCHKGDQIAVSGKLTARTVEGKDKQKHTYTSVLANNIQFLSSKKETDAKAKSNTPAKKNIDPSDSDLPF